MRWDYIDTNYFSAGKIIRVRKYIAGYVAYWFRDKYSFLGNPTRDLGSLDNSEYIMMLSRGGLMYPSEEFIKVANIMDDVFEEFHGSNQLKRKTKHIFQKVADLVMEKNDSVPRDALLCLVRTRTYIRLRKWNMEIREENRFKKTAKKVEKRKKLRKCVIKLLISNECFFFHRISNDVPIHFYCFLIFIYFSHKQVI